MVNHNFNTSIARTAIIIEEVDKDGNKKLSIINMRSASITLENRIISDYGLFETNITLDGILGESMEYHGPMPGDDMSLTNTKEITDGEEEVIVGELIEDD